jgi:hypothetical protein
MFDNDFDQLLDCADPDCAARNPCGTPVPAASPASLVVLIAVLGALGALGMARLRKV